jgi:lipooligosaccharide transport system permease protein
MKTNNFPSFPRRIGAIWFRHFRVYARSFFSNALPPFLDPMIFLMGVGFGLGAYMGPSLGGESYLAFLAGGLLLSSAMYTAAFECTYGTFIRMEFDKAYDGMLTAPMSASELLLGEILWAGSKGFFFSFAVLVVMLAVGIFHPSLILLAPFAGFLTGLVFAVLGMLVTALVKNINHFNFFFTGLLSPMFFFSGIVFPLDKLPVPMKIIAEFLPLTHPVRLVRDLYAARFSLTTLWDLAYIVLFIFGIGLLAVNLLKRRLID